MLLGPFGLPIGDRDRTAHLDCARVGLNYLQAPPAGTCGAPNCLRPVRARKKAREGWGATPEQGPGDRESALARGFTS